jgi:hypothetical protein
LIQQFSGTIDQYVGSLDGLRSHADLGMDRSGKKNGNQKHKVSVHLRNPQFE